MGERVKIHMIGNAHLDPVWLWSWRAGVDEALATAYTAVKLLHEFPELIFTRSDVWFHQTVETLNPELFAQIRQLVRAGRWRIVGGWYIQPDCNLPTEYAFRKHIEIGHQYFHDRFNVTTTIGYNVDSFGHAGSLPRILAEAGYQSYIYMRPGSHEKEYAAKSPVFWWQAADSDHRILAYRIAGAYCANVEQLPERIGQCIGESDPALGHAMCFYGIGDHGGGPTRRQVEYILKNRNAHDGFELVLSHPQAYFDAIRDKAAGLPVVKGELQHHAVGCYSVLHRIKQEIRRAEHELVRAQALAAARPDAVAPTAADRLEQAWQDVLFAQFHDTYGGTCLKSAYPDLFNQIGRARAQADQEATDLLRRFSAGLPKLELGEKNLLAFFAAVNSHGQDYPGWVEHDLFVAPDREVKLVQINGDGKKELPYQKIRPECTCGWPLRVLLPVKLPAGGHQLFGVKGAAPGPVETDLRVNHDQIAGNHWQVKARPTGLFLTTPANTLNLTWQVFEDLSDTWSHDRTRLGDRHIGAFTLTQDKPVLMEESGPLRACLTWQGDFVHSRLRVRARIYREEKWIELLISLFWSHPRAMVKMVIEPKEPLTEWLSGVPGGTQPRELDGREYPFHDWTLLAGRQNRIAVISPDVFGFDAQKENARFTLVRSPAWAHHDPFKLDEACASHDYIDQGEHEYRVLIAANGAFDPAALARFAAQIQQPPILWDPPYREGYPRE